MYNSSFCFNDTATTEIYTLSLHDALPISCRDNFSEVFFLPSRRKSERLAQQLQRPSALLPNGCDTPLLQPGGPRWRRGIGRSVDRKSTRLNSSHANISYAVFCLKKKKLV